MDAYFEEALGRLKLTKNQKEDAIKKYQGVAKTLHNAFYEEVYDGRTKLLIGSYGKLTNIRPPSDVDLLFKIPEETFAHYYEMDSKGPSALLQKVRAVLGERYVTSERISAWGKVVLVKFKDGTHSVEVLPAFDSGDGVYTIPNTEAGGSWDSFDVGRDLKIVSETARQTGGVSRKLIKLLKRWKKLNKTMIMKSYEIEEYVAQYFDERSYSGESWSTLVADFFVWLENATNSDVSFIISAKNRALKAIEYENLEKEKDARDEWFKVFGNIFPAYTKSKNAIHRFTKAEPADTEEFIEDKYPVKINSAHNMSIRGMVTKKGFRPSVLDTFLQTFKLLIKNARLSFEVDHNIGDRVDFHWKVRNFGQQARSRSGYRGEINQRGEQIVENTLYFGTHYVECYAIVDGVCVAKATQFVPIGNDE